MSGLAQQPALAPLRAADLPLLEQMVRAYYAEDGHRFDAERQPAALAALDRRRGAGSTSNARSSTSNGAARHGARPR